MVGRFPGAILLFGFVWGFVSVTTGKSFFIFTDLSDSDSEYSSIPMSYEGLRWRIIF